MNEGYSESFDLIVVGGGPGGSTLATFVAMQGHKVLLLEREHFPRYQIGESLLPATIHGICVMLGVSEDIKQADFMIKKGGTFRCGKDALPWTFNFGGSALLGPIGYAYQVERSKFDAILLENARRKGVEVRECNLVKELLRGVFHAALRRPETMKRGTVHKCYKCDKVKTDERRRQVVYSLSHQSSERSLTRVAHKRPRLSLRQAPEERGGEFPQLC